MGEYRWIDGGMNTYDTLHGLPAEYNAVWREQLSQRDKWGRQHHDPIYWLGILMEEVGELSKELIDGKAHAASGNYVKAKHHIEDAIAELVQVAAVAMSMLDDMTGHRAPPDEDDWRGYATVPEIGEDPAMWWEEPQT